jgi:dolichyl-phosphate beta-glucosyltransferase
VSSARTDLSVVIPAYNEQERLESTLSAVSAHFADSGLRVEVIVVDDGSDDETPLRAGRFKPPDGLSLRVLSNETNRGKGATVKRGMLAATGRFALLSDADLSTPIEEWLVLKAALDQGHDVAIGSRGLRDSRVELHQPWYRESMGRSFNLLIRMLGLSRFKDTQCGFKLFTSEASREIFSRLTLDRFGFDVEALLIADRLGYRVKEIPVIWRDSQGSRVRPVRDAFRMGVDSLLIKARDLAGRYNRGSATSGATSQNDDGR